MADPAPVLTWKSSWRSRRAATGRERERRRSRWRQGTRPATSESEAFDNEDVGGNPGRRRSGRVEIADGRRGRRGGGLLAHEDRRGLRRDIRAVAVPAR